MKKKQLFLNLILPLGLFGQSVVVIPNTEKYGENGIVYDNSLFFSKNYKLVKFDGVSVTGTAEPSYNNQPINGQLRGSMIIYNNKLCYSYDYYNPESPIFSHLNKDYFITYDGTNYNVLLNPYYVYAEGGITIEDGESDFKPIEYNGKLILRSNSTNANYPASQSSYFHLWSFDGQVLTRIDNPYFINNPYINVSLRPHLGNWALVYNNDLYFGYTYTGSYGSRIAKFDGTNIALLDDNFIYYGGIFNLANNLYFNMFMSPVTGIINYIPASNTFLLAASIPPPMSDVNNKPLIHNSKAYLATGNKKLSVFDGAIQSQIGNPVSGDNGVVGNPVLFGTDVFFQYQGTGGKYFLGKYTPGDTGLSIISNPSAGDTGIGAKFKEFNGALYFTYKTSAVSPNVIPSYLAKYDGNAITVFPNPDGGLGVRDNSFVVYNNELYFSYENVNKTVVLAKYGTAVLSTDETVKETGVSVFKDNNGFSVVSKTNKIAKIEVLDASGREILNAKANAQKYSFEIGNHGVFMVNVTLENGKVSTLKVRN
ncbi:hypothetical protein ACM46_02415 [Chryseobacterium angstadtii]|uniref:Secretion system C-terminal sorting domain-containing protein n=1 Tax=Chryseobacterium angstadtii TaxID=558151 RepID=A0A0J7IKE3_9FLAO|nr:hypothetical protein [Chryseobacterium angstadtii]KMQ66409.1 hypothetical protein ACM46_02415 [Chryseobacterium angstadtii]